MTRIKAPERLHRGRLVLRRPGIADAAAIFARYAADPEVTRPLGWPTHRALDDTRLFRIQRRGNGNAGPPDPT